MILVTRIAVGDLVTSPDLIEAFINHLLLLEMEKSDESSRKIPCYLPQNQSRNGFADAEHSFSSNLRAFSDVDDFCRKTYGLPQNQLARSADAAHPLKTPIARLRIKRVKGPRNCLIAHRMLPLALIIYSPGQGLQRLRGRP